MAQAKDQGTTHLVVTDPAWGGSGTDGDPWVMLSWDLVPCTCSTPWQHAHGTR